MLHNANAATGAGVAHRSPPAPEYILRAHEAQINTLSFVHPGNLLLSGDADGYVGVWSMDSFRPLLFSKLHAASVLTVASWAAGSKMLTHGRDNKMNIYDLEAIASVSQPQISTKGAVAHVNPLYSIDTNALGYCKCAILEFSSNRALVAVPSTLDDNLADIFDLHSCKRLHRSIGKDVFDFKTGTVMALGMTSKADQLTLLIAYESGRVAMFKHAGYLLQKHTGWPEENEGWQLIWETQQHKEPVMSLCIDLQHNTAWTVSADHFVVRYSLSEDSGLEVRSFKTAYPGRGAIAVRDDGRILATAGWDGALRLHSAASFRPLAVLEYHRDSLYAVAFQATTSYWNPSMLAEGSARMAKKEERQGWLAVAGTDARISLWSVYPPSSEQSGFR